MKLVTFSEHGTSRIGVMKGEIIIDLTKAAPQLPCDMRTLLEAGDEAMHFVQKTVEPIKAGLPLHRVALAAPIPDPRKFLAIGGNYQSHLDEIARIPEIAHLAETKIQIWFNKQVSCISGPYDDILRPEPSSALDYEVELAVVMGKRCHRVSGENADDYVAGYMIGNDISVRNWQHSEPSMFLGKSYDTHGPLGPWLVTRDEIADICDLTLRCYVNGELRQKAQIREMRFSIGKQIEYLSHFITLEPGDILLTGTPAGIGALHIPPKFLQPNDVIKCEINGLGFMENKVVDREPS